jgi:arylformamidase
VEAAVEAALQTALETPRVPPWIMCNPTGEPNPMSQKVFHEYNQTALDAQFDNRAKVPAYPEYLARYRRQSEEARAAFSGRQRLDVPVGPSAIERVDIFTAGSERPAPVLVFIHGGYWLMLDKSDFSFVANGFVPHGITTVVINYALIPSVRMDEVVRQCRQAVAWVLANASQFGGDPRRVSVAGHSAGGHLTAMVGATDWESFTAPMVETPVETRPIAGFSLSGLHDLLPISRSYLQKDLQLSPDEVERNSPVDLAPPQAGAWLALVGDREGPEYHRQSTELARRWTSAGHPNVVARLLDGHDHFSIVAALADPDDPLTLQIADGVTGR